MTLIERVACAISGAPFPSERSRRTARAAIEAMFDVDDEMLAAGARALRHDQEEPETLLPRIRQAGAVYHAMIRTSLGEKP